jgi:hypothetical protein
VKRLALIFTLAIIGSLIAIPALQAQPFADSPGEFGNTTHLNNIPITDTLEEGTFEWDVLAGYSDHLDKGRAIRTRLFGALFQNFEFGMTWGLDAPAGPMMLSFKYKVLDEYDGGICGDGNGFPVSFAVGAEGITGDITKDWGRDATYYGVIGLHDVHLISWWDWYVGLVHNPTGFDDEDNSIFGGFKFWINDDLQINADYMGYDSNEFNVITAGINYDLINHIGLQGWVERDSLLEDYMVVLQFTARADMRDLHAEVSDPE